MPSPAELGPRVIGSSAPPLREAVVHEDATEPGQEIKCIVPSFGREWTSDPLQWNPVVKPAGFFYPKKDDRAVIGYPTDGPPFVAQWWPSDSASPDVPL